MLWRKRIDVKYKPAEGEPQTVYVLPSGEGWGYHDGDWEMIWNSKGQVLTVLSNTTD